MENLDLAATYDQLLELHSRLFEAGHYAAAYHVLAAATHAADDWNDRDRLAAIKRLAMDRGAWLDDKGDTISNSAALRRGSKGVFASLASTVEAMIVRIKADEVIEKNRGRSLPETE